MVVETHAGCQGGLEGGPLRGRQAEASLDGARRGCEEQDVAFDTVYDFSDACHSAHGPYMPSSGRTRGQDSH